jgi:hypothetical protein
MVFNHDKVCQWLATGWWFSPRTLISSTNKTNRLDIAEILSKVALNTITPNHIPCCIFFYSFFFGDKRTSNTILFLCTKTGDCYWIERREKQLSFFGVKNNSGRLFYQEQFLFGMNETFDHHRMNAVCQFIMIRFHTNTEWQHTVNHYRWPPLSNLIPDLWLKADFLLKIEWWQVMTTKWSGWVMKWGACAIACHVAVCRLLLHHNRHPSCRRSMIGDLRKISEWITL